MEYFGPPPPPCCSGAAAHSGEEGARRHVDAFVDEATGYDDGRNLPSEERTSRPGPVTRCQT